MTAGSAPLAWPLRWVLRQAARACGVPRAFAPADRRLLEQSILPHYAARPAGQSVLFVGTRRYTQHYERLFEAHRFVTLDIDPAAARYGSSQGHVVDCASRAAQHFAPASLDLIVVNGVFGWGLDAPATVDAALRGFGTLLREGGELLIGWNDVPGRRPLPFAQHALAQGFVRGRFAPLGVERIEVPGGNRHRYEFFRKPGPAEVAAQRARVG
jgi:SAM-dependent methyltransferase